MTELSVYTTTDVNFAGWGSGGGQSLSLMRKKKIKRALAQEGDVHTQHGKLAERESEELGGGVGCDILGKRLNTKTAAGIHGNSTRGPRPRHTTNTNYV